MPAGAVTALLNSLAPDAFASLAAEMGVETTAPPADASDGAEPPQGPAEGQGMAPEDGGEEEAPPSSDRPAAEPTPEGMASYAQQALSDAKGHHDEIEQAMNAATTSGDKKAAKAAKKALKKADASLKDAQKAAEKAADAASAGNMVKAAQAAADVKVACEEIEALLSEAKGHPVAEGESPESNPGDGVKKMKPAGSPWGQWAAQG